MGVKFKEDVAQNIKVHRDTRRSVVILKSIKKIILEILGAEKITFLEQEMSNASIILDRTAGLDCLVQKNGVLYGMATRVQWCNEPYNTYTVRYKRNTGNKTEYEKRSDQINIEGSIYPHWTLQTFFSRIGEFLSVGIIETRKLYEHIESNFDTLDIRKTDNASFIVVDWEALKPDMNSITADNWG